MGCIQKLFIPTYGDKKFSISLDVVMIHKEYKRMRLTWKRIIIIIIIIIMIMIFVFWIQPNV